MGGKLFLEPQLGEVLSPKGPATKEQYLLKPPKDIAPLNRLAGVSIHADHSKYQRSVLVSSGWVLEFDEPELLLGIGVLLL